ncbi:MAG: ABC transporter permease [Candidatus Thermoplasmatota archaeon]
MAVRQHLRTFWHATWLGWQLESNWTDPFLFMIYSIAKPIAGALILVVMYTIITLGNTTGPMFSYMYVGNAFYMFIAQVLFGVTWIIHDDREHYQTLRYLYISPSNFFVYILGRSVSKVLITTFGVGITLAFGVAALGVQIDPFTVDWLLLFLSLALGLVCILAFGLALAGISFLTAKHSMGMNEGIAGIFYLFCGVIFPVQVLPSWSHGLAVALPLTYWMHVTRIALFGAGSNIAAVDTVLGPVGVAHSLGILTMSTLLFFLLSVLVFRVGDYIARKKGLIDMTTAY